MQSGVDIVMCDCGFQFETRDGYYRNFEIKLTPAGGVVVCPQCKKESQVDPHEVDYYD